LAITLLDEPQRLNSAGWADGYHHLAFRTELVAEGSRNVVGCGSDDYAVVGCVLLPAKIAVANTLLDFVTRGGECSAGAFRQFRNDFDRVDVRAHFGEDCGLITGACAYFQYLVARLHVKQLGHQGYDERLRNRLALANRQGIVVICLVAIVVWDEFLTGYRQHG